MSFKVLLVYPNIQLSNLLPNNIAILSACLKKANFEVKIFDTTFYKIKDKSDDEIRADWGHYKPSNIASLYNTSNVYDDFILMFNEYKPNVIGFSCVDSTYPIACNLLDKIDTKNCHVIFGGIYPTFASDKVLENPKINSVCIGEGEEVLIELCQKLKNHISIDYIENLHINKGSYIQKNNARSLIDLNTIPYDDFSEFEEKRFLRPMQGLLKRMIPLVIDRGCPYNCTFCASSSLKERFGHRYYRIKNLNTMPDYLTYLKSTYKPEYIYFNSETFFARPEYHIEKFAELYEHYIHLPFCCMSRFETINERHVQILKEMGCDRISFGLEHGNEEYRSKMLNKKFTNKQIFDALKYCNNYGINISLFNMIGLPEETENLAIETINLNKEIRNKYKKIDITHSISIFQPFRSSLLRQYCINKGYMTPDIEASSLISESILNMPKFSKERIFELTKDFINLIN